MWLVGAVAGAAKAHLAAVTVVVGYGGCTGWVMAGDTTAKIVAAEEVTAADILNASAVVVATSDKLRLW